MKQRIIKFTPEQLTWALQNKLTQYNLPLDIELIDIKYDAFTKHVSAVIRSDLFEDTTEGTPTPELTHEKTPRTLIQSITPTQTTPQTEKDNTTAITTKTVTIATPAFSPNSGRTSTDNNIGTGIKTLGAKPEINIDTCGFEEEFTKEQRKVLKFTSTDDFVIVKPTQFLKTEWEDINVTVKSIGGRWIKDTIDHWLIPKNKKQQQEDE
ncbi:MAG: hypothetical protein FWC14_00375 [Candidatus Bathyarchaeota archaeon]|uniref:hypothetical protein n=1 Tax=Candidatus Bathycorpusculum sp. TaxID=2994959 RepID=UPI00282EE9FF|nr:hypothetical protein [Candidatus Termiticorpusculum sp.]MCL2293171.1 hypothetical protein [Candidatus Termiticorpusculum sp.]